MSYNSPYNNPGPYVPPSGQPVYGQAPPRGLSIASMVLGIASVLFGWTVVVPLTGVVLGIVGIRKEPAGKAMAITGLVLNGLALSVWVVLLLILVAVGAIFATTVATTAA